MFKKSFRYILITLLFIMNFFIITSVNASSNYETLSSRLEQNKKMINISNNLSSISRARYSDKYLKDLAETNYKGIDTTKQTKIQNFVDEIILENNKENLTNEEKILKIHDWIIENFYYYQYPNKIYSLSASGNNYDNPYYLLTYEYDENGKIRARSNGFASTLVAFARTQGIPARTVGGYYYKSARIDYINWGSNVTNSTINHKFVQVYLNGKWIVIDPVADSYQEYLEETDTYTENLPDLDEKYKHQYYNPDMDTLSASHVMLKYYPGLKNVKYISNNYERTKVLFFLNKIYNGKSNGKRVNSLYNKTNSSTWFASNTGSSGDGFGNFTRIYWGPNKNLYGSLDLSGFGYLQKLSAYSNKITSLNLSNCPSINTVSVASNKMSKIIVTGSSNLKLLSARGNPATYVKYNYGKTKRTAIIKATTGGTVSIRYEKTSSGKHQHLMKAITKKGYVFKGWYSGSKKIRSSSSIVVYNTQSFTYTAKFVKKPTNTYILVSIKKQKLWYYKKGVLKLTTNVVTGQKGKHDTPKGTYKILGKARSVYLIGPDYKTYVNYWMLLSRKYQIGLHDATWRSSFGGSIYKYNGSHGCINMPYSKAQYIYKYVPVGTKVIIK